MASNVKCARCGGKATKKVIWADGRAYQPACSAHVKAVQLMLTRKNGKMTELAGVQDLTDSDCNFIVDLVASAAYPSLERKPGGPDNWVERAGGLPKYIERIAKHLHYEKGYAISRAIATAVNTVKRWARMGKVAKYGDPNNKHVTPKTAAKAAKAVAQWESKRAAGKINLSDVLEFVIDLTDVDDLFALELAEEIESIDLSQYDRMGTGAEPREHGTLLSMDIKVLAQRANQITEPGARAAARRKVLDLSLSQSATTIDLASTIAPRNARGRATDGRRSYRGQGKWKHGFVPVDSAATEAKAKGSPIASKRINRIYGGAKKSASTKSGGVRVSDKGVNESASSLGNLRNAKFEDSVDAKHTAPTTRKESSKQSRTPPTAKQPWEDIPESQKTVRNGKRYVVTKFGGKNVITEWAGGTNEISQDPLNKRKTQVTLASSDAARMTTAQLRQLIKNPKTSAAARKSARKALRAKGGT